MRKRLVLALTAILCVIGMIGFSPKTVLAADKDTEIQVSGKVDNQDNLLEQVKTFIESNWNQTDFTSLLSSYSDQLEEEDIKKYQDWEKLQKEAGDYKNIVSVDFSTEDEDKVTVIKAVANYEKEKLLFTVKTGNNTSDINVEKYKEPAKQPLAETMKNAGINTVMSITIVFVVLIFIAGIISLFGLIPKLFASKKQEEKTVDVATVAEVPVVEDVTDDTEIVAVITAAIMASMGDEAPVDGLHITSIKRRVNSKWKRS
ncbi:MAG: OadG family protein [Lachnospiraceae bacterium]|jgi:sodium pump decarboxylase gamma subunit|nr:OadG family protein [Lachnospiraceae bacterium]